MCASTSAEEWALYIANVIPEIPHNRVTHYGTAVLQQLDPGGDIYSFCEKIGQNLAKRHGFEPRLARSSQIFCLMLYLLGHQHISA